MSDAARMRSSTSCGPGAGVGRSPGRRWSSDQSSRSSYTFICTSQFSRASGESRVRTLGFRDHARSYTTGTAMAEASHRRAASAVQHAAEDGWMSAGPMWQPSPERVRSARMSEFMRAASARHGLRLDDYAGLYDWSIDRHEDFWRFVWDWCGVRGTPGDARARRRRPHAGRALVPRRTPQLRREPPAPPRRRRRARLPGRGSGAQRAGRIASSTTKCRRVAQRAAGGRRRAGRSRGRLSCRTCRRASSRCSRRRASARSGRRARPTSACAASSTASARSRRRCSSPPTATATTARRIRLPATSCARSWRSCRRSSAS